MNQQLKIYISGKITGLEKEMARAKFAEAETILHNLHFLPVNPMKNGLPFHAPWDEHLLRDIQILLRCDGIYMLKCWKDSPGARIEHFIARERKLIVIMEEPDQDPWSKLNAQNIHNGNTEVLSQLER